MKEGNHAFLKVTLFFLTRSNLPEIRDFIVFEYKVLIPITSFLVLFLKTPCFSCMIPQTVVLVTLVYAKAFNAVQE